MTSWIRWRTLPILLAMLTLVQALTVWPSHAQTTVSVYPQGTAFPLQLYSLDPDSDIPLVTPNGWNIGHEYGCIDNPNPPPAKLCWKDGSRGVDALNELLQTFAANGIEGLPALPSFITDVGAQCMPSPHCRSAWEEADIASWIQALVPNTNIAYWDLPEELRYFRPLEWEIVTNYTVWTRTYDPQRRPNYMYLPTHYTKDQVQNYVRVRELDIIPATAYADLKGWPHAWVRWRMEETIRGINGCPDAPACIGKDYLSGQKTPVGIVQLFVGPNKVIPTPEQTYHDFWQLIASGAQGIFVFSYFHGQKDAGGALIPNWNLLQQAASQITGPEQLGDVVLYGTAVSGVTVTVLAGPAETVSFTPTGYTTPVQFPSIHLFTQQWNGNTYIIAVNSTDQDVTAQISNVPTTSTSATVLFQNRAVPISDGSFSDVFSAWGVNIYKM